MNKINLETGAQKSVVSGIYERGTAAHGVYPVDGARTYKRRWGL